MDRNLKPYVAELIGTFALVFLGAGTVCSSQFSIGKDQPQPYLVGIALAEGLILAAAVSATMNVSGGYLNPAVTLMLWVFRRLEGFKTCALIAAQLLGAILAGFCLRLIYNDSVFHPAHLGTPHLNVPAFGGEAGSEPTLAMLFSGIGIELALTFLLTFAIFGTVIDPRAPRLGGLGVGLAMTANILMGYDLTRAAANPARWLGPVVWERTLEANAFRDHAIYWIGPILGALLAGGIYTALILPPGDMPTTAAAAHGAPGLAAGPASTLARTRK